MVCRHGWSASAARYLTPRNDAPLTDDGLHRSSVRRDHSRAGHRGTGPEAVRRGHPARHQSRLGQPRYGGRAAARRPRRREPGRLIGDGGGPSRARSVPHPFSSWPGTRMSLGIKLRRSERNAAPPDGRRNAERRVSRGTALEQRRIAIMAARDHARIDLHQPVCLVSSPNGTDRRRRDERNRGENAPLEHGVRPCHVLPLKSRPHCDRIPGAFSVCVN